MQNENICKVFSIKIFTLLFTECVKNEFDIKFELATSINGLYRVEYYAYDKGKGWIIETVSDIKPTEIDTRAIFNSEASLFDFDFSEVKGQESVKRATQRYSAISALI